MNQTHSGSGDNVGGDKIAGDKVARDKITNYISLSGVLTYSDKLPFDRPEPYLTRQIFKQKEGAFQSYDRQSCDLIHEIKDHKRIVLLGDAGMGKSTELKHLCYQLKDAGYLPIHLRLDNYQNPNEALSILSEQADKIVLVLDGLDEAKIENAKRVIERFSDYYPNSRIVVSCRNSAYANTLKDFETYELGFLVFSEVKGYLDNQLGSFSDTFLRYWSERYPYNPLQLINNPFFLIKICEYVQANGNRPPNSLAEVFEYFITNALELRLKDISRYGDGNFEKQRESCIKSLEKLAFVMECRGESVISKVDLKAVIPDDNERDELLGKSSLIEVQDNESWRFVHNNFQEYLAAKVLARAKSLSALKRIIAAKPHFERLKLSWINTLFFLFGIVDKNELIKHQLSQWLAKDNLGLGSLIKIMSLGDEIHPQKFKQEVFLQVFERHKKEDIYFDSTLYNYRDLAKLSNHPDTFFYLLSELKTPNVTSTVKNNIFKLLKSLSKNLIPLTIQDDLKIELIKHIYDFQANTPVNRGFAIDALSQLCEISEKEACKIVETFFDSTDANELSSVYRFIRKQKLQLQFLEPLIKRGVGIENRHFEKNTVKLGDEKGQIESCFEELTEEYSLVHFFEKYPETMKDQHEIIKGILLIMITKLGQYSISEDSAKSIYFAMREKFIRYFSLFMNNHRDLVMKFIEKYSFSSDFVNYCLDQRRPLTAIYFLNTHNIEHFALYIKQALYDRSWIINQLLPYCKSLKNELLQPLMEKLNEFSEPPFSDSDIPAPIDWDKLDLERALFEKELIFNQSKLVSKIQEIFTNLSKDKFDKNEIYDLTINEENHIQKYPHFLLRLINDFSLHTFSELNMWIQNNWDWFFVSALKDYLKEKKQLIEKKSALSLNVQEINQVKSWCDAHHEQINWEAPLTNADVMFAWLTLTLEFNHYTENVYFNFLNSDLQYHVGAELNVIEFMVNQCNVPIVRIKERLLDLLKNKKLTASTVSLILKFIKKHEISEALPIVKDYIESTHERSTLYTQTEALKIYIHLNGSIDYLHLLLTKLHPTPEDYRENILLEFFINNPDPESEKIILKKLNACKVISQQLKYAQYLLKLNNLEGLRFLVKHVEKEQKSPFEESYFGHNYSFENPKGIHLLLKLLNFEYGERMKTDFFRSINYTVEKMLSHLASCQNGKYFLRTTKAIRHYIQWHTRLNKLPKNIAKLLKAANPETIKTLQYKLKDIEAHHFHKQEVSLEEAISLWQGIS